MTLKVKGVGLGSGRRSLKRGLVKFFSWGRRGEERRGFGWVKESVVGRRDRCKSIMDRITHE